MSTAALDLTPHPGGSFEVSLTDDQIAAFARDGFTWVPRITTDEELEWLRTIYDWLFDGKRGAFKGGYFDLARPYDADGEDLLPQVLGPEKRFPQLLETIYYRNCRKLAAQLLGVDPSSIFGWGHMIRKPARIGHETPWHQDEAYWDTGYDYRAVGVWMPLDVASVESGCMQFIPGSHTGDVLPHSHINDDPATHGLYTTAPVDTTKAVAVPLEPGGATMHHPRMLHFTGPNTTGHQRRAYANEFQLPSTKRATPAERPWVEAGQEEWNKRDLR